MTIFTTNKIWRTGILVLALFLLQSSSVLAQAGINDIGSFEQTLPSFWKKGVEPAGATLSWATDQSRSMGRSLKIQKSVTGEAAVWESENMVDLWSDRHFKDVDIKAGIYYRTEGVNTNPANDDARWYVVYTFYRQDNSVIGEQRFEINQTVANTSTWTVDSTDIGELILPEDAFKTIVKFIGGKDATGTVWTDDYFFLGRENKWAGQNWNTQLGVPTGWYYWLPPIGGNDGVLSDGFENTRITDEQAYDGKYSLKFDIPVGTHDGFVSTVKFPLNPGGGVMPEGPVDISQVSDVNPGDVLRISVWIKASNLKPDSVAAVGDQWSVALTPMFHNKIGNNTGYGDFWASDIPLKFPNATSFDWKQFYIDVPVQQGALALSVRLHPLGRFQGTVYMDKLEVTKVSEVTDVADEKTVSSYALLQNYPNPFNPSTSISYSLPKSSMVSLVIYDMLGREVKTLVSGEQNAGMKMVTWNGDNNSGSKVTSGAYIYVLKAGEFTEAKKLLLMK